MIIKDPNEEKVKMCPVVEDTPGELFSLSIETFSEVNPKLFFIIFYSHVCSRYVANATKDNKSDAVEKSIDK